ncbi:MAG: hypothetical protein ABSB35_33450 [Bryobacteraceae bacterium]
MNRSCRYLALRFSAATMLLAATSAFAAESKKATLQTVTQQFQQATATVIGTTQRPRRLQMPRLN